MPQRPGGQPPADQEAGPRTAAARSRARRERDRLKIAALEAEIRKLRGARFDQNMIEIGATTMNRAGKAKAPKP